MINIYPPTNNKHTKISLEYYCSFPTFPFYLILAAASLVFMDIEGKKGQKNSLKPYKDCFI